MNRAASESSSWPNARNGGDAHVRDTTLIVPKDDLRDWGHHCRVEAAWTTHPETRKLLLELAAEFEALAPHSVSESTDYAPKMTVGQQS